jgi:hypothetical protein
LINEYRKRKREKKLNELMKKSGVVGCSAITSEPGVPSASHLPIARRSSLAKHGHNSGNNGRLSVGNLAIEHKK